MSPGGVSASTGQAANTALKLREAIALHEQGRVDEAERCYREMLKNSPNQADALHFLGVIESQRGRYGEAVELIDRSLAVRPRNPAAQYNRANILRDIGRTDEALRGYGETLKLHPGHIGALINRAALLGSLGQHADALNAYEQALAIASANATLHYGRALALTKLNRFDEGILAFDRAITLSPGTPDFRVARGHALCSAGRPGDALFDFDAAINADPHNADAFAGRAVACMELRRFADALASYDRALEIDAEKIELLYGRGSALIELGRQDEAIAELRRLIAIRPNYPYALGMLVHAQKTGCNWTDMSAELLMVKQVREGKKVASPFALLPVSDSPADMLQCARILMRDKFDPALEPLWRGERYHHDRIRVAYVSADLRTHPVGQLIAGVVESHDRSRFEIIAIAYTGDDGSELRRRLTRGFDRFIETGSMSDLAIARMMREMEIDIAVDLTGLTANCRPGILAFRPAPVQANYLGYAGSMGSTRIDYVIGDSIVIPEEHEEFYDEKVVRLPVPFIPLDVKPARSPGTAVSRTAAGLPERGFVFASFNNSYKINPAMFDVWMRLLRQIPDSLLWLAAPNLHAAHNLKTEAESRGVAADRILFAPRLPRIEDHLARLSLADLFLDTVPYNAHATAVDALRAGVPVLTCRGAAFAGRGAASLLAGAGLSQLITTSLDEYERRALVLARNTDELAKLKAGLIEWRAHHARSGGHRFVRNLESAFRQMWTRAGQGLPPASFPVLEE